MSLVEPHVINIIAGVVDVGDPFLLSLDALTILKLVLAMENDEIVQSNASREVLLVRKYVRL